MRQVRIFFGNTRKFFNTDVVTLEDFIKKLRDEDVFDSSDSDSDLLEKYSFMKPNENGSQTELEFKSLSAKLPEGDFNMFIAAKKSKFGGIENDLEYLTETVDNLETELSEIKEMVENILDILEEGGFSSFANKVPSNNYELEGRAYIDPLEEAYKKLQGN